jgi:DNA-binding NtrC family response regulator
MSIALFVNAFLPIDEIASVLRRGGLDILSINLDSQLTAARIASDVAKAILVIPGQGVVSIGEQTALVRKLLGPEPFLILCTAEPTTIDRRLLIQCGASEIITPQAWSAGYVAERILGELILEGDVQPCRFGTLQGATDEMQQLYHHIQKIAPLSEPILILGETGTGKELVAREIHKHSGRAAQFLAINCPELGPELLGSELFGHERGAFTGAVQARKGLLVEAGKGTVFLDEIGDLDQTAQAKLLRVLENHQVRPVGSNKWFDVQARIVLATNRNLREDCIEGKFRSDLYERIQGFTLELAPLRERKADIPLLVHHFIREYSTEYPAQISVPAGALDCLFHYDWPGNVRELRSVVRKAAAYSDNAGNISAVYLQEVIRNREGTRPRHSVTFDPAVDSWRDLLYRTQMIYFKAVLAEAGGNKDAAAKLAGLSRSQFYEKLREMEKTKANPETKLAK